MHAHHLDPTSLDQDADRRRILTDIPDLDRADRRHAQPREEEQRARQGLARRQLERQEAIDLRAREGPRQMLRAFDLREVPPPRARGIGLWQGSRTRAPLPPAVASPKP
jgi:hypothetical protein